MPYVVNQIARLCLATILLLLCACSSPKPKSRPSVAAPVEGAIDRIQMLAIPVALNLDQQAGLDGFGVKVYATSMAHPKPVPIRDGTLEIVMYDGLLPGGTNVVPPRCAWSYSASELRQYELHSSIGLAYQLAPRWGENRPQQKRITVVARYKPKDETVFESGPSVITIPTP